MTKLQCNNEIKLIKWGYADTDNKIDKMNEWIHDLLIGFLQVNELDGPVVCISDNVRGHFDVSDDNTLCFSNNETSGSNNPESNLVYKNVLGKFAYGRKNSMRLTEEFFEQIKASYKKG